MSVQVRGPVVIGLVCGLSARLLRSVGHTKGDWEDEDGCICMLAAINMVIGARNISDSVPKNIIRTIHEHLYRTQPSYRAHVNSTRRPTSLRDENCRIWSWNDAEGVTANDVIAVLEGIERALASESTLEERTAAASMMDSDTMLRIVASPVYNDTPVDQGVLATT